MYVSTQGLGDVGPPPCPARHGGRMTGAARRGGPGILPECYTVPQYRLVLRHSIQRQRCSLRREARFTADEVMTSDIELRRSRFTCSTLE